MWVAVEKNFGRIRKSVPFCYEYNPTVVTRTKSSGILPGCTSYWDVHPTNGVMALAAAERRPWRCVHVQQPARMLTVWLE